MKAKGTIAIIGGGLAGLTSAILLNRSGYRVTLLEKKSYPFHRVCGEYVSNEVLPFLKSSGINLEAFGPSPINRLLISSASGNSFGIPLRLGGFGLSRYTLDDALFRQAENEGVEVLQDHKVNDLTMDGDGYHLTLHNGRTLSADLAVNASGKRSNLDQRLQRSFFRHKTNFLGVKYHVIGNFSRDTIELHSFPGGYCGLVKVEAERYCLCYLAKDADLKIFGGIRGYEKDVLHRNPLLKERFQNSNFLFERPEVIHAISFEKREFVEDGLLYCGDSAGLITPLCGNGMAIALHTAKILTDSINRHSGFTRSWSERDQLLISYEKSCKAAFGRRLKVGRLLQQWMIRHEVGNLMIGLLKKMPIAAEFMVGLTHGRAF